MNDKRLIDANELKYIEPDANAYSEEWNADYEKGFRDCLDKVMALPTVEAITRKDYHSMTERFIDDFFKENDANVNTVARCIFIGLTFGKLELMLFGNEDGE